MDDYAPKPMSPSLSFDEIAEEPLVEPQDQVIADTYYRDEIEKIILEQVANWRNLAALDDKLPPDQFKIEAVANIKAAGLLVAVWEKVKNARVAVDNADRPRTKTGDS